MGTVRTVIAVCVEDGWVIWVGRSYTVLRNMDVERVLWEMFCARQVLRVGLESVCKGSIIFCL